MFLLSLYLFFKNRTSFHLLKVHDFPGRFAKKKPKPTSDLVHGHIICRIVMWFQKERHVNHLTIAEVEYILVKMAQRSKITPALNQVMPFFSLAGIWFWLQLTIFSSNFLKEETYFSDIHVIKVTIPNIYRKATKNFINSFLTPTVSTATCL